MARPVTLRPNTAAAMPEVSADFRSFTFRIKPGIHFDDDPAFKGNKRELTAADYVYSIKRHYDPRWKSGNLYILENAKILGLWELRQQALDAKKPFDYDTEVEGLRALDRYTFQIRLAEPEPALPLQPGRRLLHRRAGARGGRGLRRQRRRAPGGHRAVPAGAVEAQLAHGAGEEPELPRGALRRASAGRRRAAAGHRPQFKGRRLPMVDQVQIAVIEEPQPRWLSFLNDEQDLLEGVPAEFANIAIPNNQLAPNLAKRGIGMLRLPRADVAVTYFGMEHPVVGGYTPDKVALRRAIALAVDLDREIRLVRRGQAVPAQSPIAPGTWGYDPAFKSEMSEYNLARAKALLDLYGYVDHDGDGWREQPDGQPLLLEYATSARPAARQLSELWKKNMDAMGLRIEFKVAKWPEQLKASRAGKLMMWGVGWSAGQPDARHLPGAGLRPEQGPGQPRALRPAGLQPSSTSASACCPTAPSARC